MKIIPIFQQWISVGVDLFRHSRVFRLLVLLQVALLLMIVLAVILFKPQAVNFAYSGESCSSGIVLFPSLQRQALGDAFRVEQGDRFRIFNKDIFARKLCVKPLKAPSERVNTTLGLSLFGNSIFAKKLQVVTQPYPTLARDLSAIKLISVTDPLTLGLSSRDEVFDYTLSANSKTTVCAKNEASLSCDPKELNLQHATKYDFSVSRVFQQQPVQTVSTALVETVTPVTIISSSISAGSTRYDKPKSITIEMNKQITNVKGVTLFDESGAQITVTSSINNKTVVLTFDQDLARGKRYKVTLENATATDSGSLIAPYVLEFLTSKGPRVMGANIGGSGVAVSQNLVINFDQALDTSQNLDKDITLTVNGGVAGFKSSISGSTLTINPVNDFTKCGTFSIKFSSNIASPAGIKGESAWLFNSRANCFDSFSIGKSAQGRSILAYRFGSGSNAVLYVGGVHGNEQNAKRLVDKWMAEVNANPDKVPVNRSIVIIPLVNPDGYAKNQRVNANGINLNRNFPANNWKAAIKEPSGTILPQGGGSSPLSEPESAALASYTQGLRPLVVMSYHSYAGVAVANDAGGSRSLANTYALKAGYIAKNNDTIGNTFAYDTTGAYEDWLNDKLGISCVLVELATSYDDEFSRNKSAMWMVAQSANF